MKKNEKRESRLPLLAEKVLEFMLRPLDQEDVLGDLEEMYRDKRESNGRIAAWTLCWKYILDYFPRFIFRSILWSFIMLTNYIKTAFRTMNRQKVHSFINIGGLALGLAVFTLIMTYVRHELSYDSFHQRADDIYGVAMNESLDTIAPLGKELISSLPEIEYMVRLDRFYGGGRNAFVTWESSSEQKKTAVTDFIFADSSFFEIFDFPLVSGNTDNALRERHTVVLTKSMAERVFGTADPIGQSLQYVSRSPEHRTNLTVTAVIEDVPDNSSLSFNAVISFETLELLWKASEDWQNWGYLTYITLNKSVQPEEFNEKASAFFVQQAIAKRDFDPESKAVDDYKLSMVPLRDIPFYDNNKMQYIYIISAIAFIIIVIAVINFVNLTTARSALRAREIGIRKVVGSDRRSLIRQYIVEAVVYAFMSSLLAVLLTAAVQQHFFGIFGTAISIHYLFSPESIFMFIAVTLIVGIAAGIYPALYLSSIAPARILKNEITSGEKGSRFRQALTVFQFVVTIGLIICTLMISAQLDYIKSKDLGIKSKFILYCKPSDQIWSQIDVLRERLLANPDITGVTASSGQPGLRYNMGAITEIDGTEHSFRLLAADPYYMDAIGINLIAGRNFSHELNTDKYTTIIINETAAKEFGFDDPVGQEINFYGGKRTIIGVMQDYHNRTFHHKVGPSALWYLPHYYRLNISISGNNISETVSFIEYTYNEMSPELPFEYTFLDEALADIYRQEEQTRTIIGYFSMLAVFIACLGLFGLMTFTAQRRTKEIGIRKVNGASVRNIIMLLSKDCVRWILIANIAAWPIAWYAMNRWLENFAYHIDISPTVFIMAGFTALAVALLTVSFQAVRAALANPVDALRSE